MQKNIICETASDLLDLIYPRLCAGCRTTLVKQEEHICTRCLYMLPKTNFHEDRDNPMEQLFWGRVPVEAAAALYYFERGSKCRRILHHIKYRGRKELARYLGFIYGIELAGCRLFSEADLLLPVPLHHLRERKRGFNQSEWFAGGLASGMGKELAADVLVRFEGTGTQTSKSRLQRWENVENCFRVDKPEKVTGRHVILVDDVVTTGATLEACASALLESTGVRISILTIAYA